LKDTAPLIVLCLISICAAACGGQGVSAKAGERPNVILIVLDSARADHFSGYGYAKNTTPQMDKIGGRGAVFLRNFSQGTDTPHSISKIFFSRYFSLGIFGTDPLPWGTRHESPGTIFKTFDGQQVFLSDILSANGYRTALFHDNAFFSKDSYLARKFDEYYPFETSRNQPTDGKIISALIPWIEKNKKRKFFIYCHIMSPHEPYPPKEEDKEFLPDKAGSSVDALRKKFYARTGPRAHGWSGDELRILRGLYDGNLKHTDRWIGTLHRKLGELELDQKTLLIITADHGENLGEHGLLGHSGQPFDSVTHIPLIMAYPPLIPAGVRVTGLTEAVDIMPTILEICMIDLPKSKSMDGVSLLGLIRDPKDDREFVFTKDSIRSESYKYMISEGLLYDLKKDPRETRNIVKQSPLAAERLKEKFENAMRPYKKRYEKSIRETQPAFPFYFRIKDFKIAPKDVFETSWVNGDMAVILEKASPSKPWLLNRNFSRTGGLFCLPGNGLPPTLTLSARLPEGSYQVSVLLGSAGKIRLPPEKAGFRFRFDSNNTPFACPKLIEFAREQNGLFYYHFRLGKTRVEQEKFQLQFHFRPLKERPYLIRHVQFSPARGRGKEAPKAPDEEELRRRTEQLKSLGYLH